jgi:hypothetical protein
VRRKGGVIELELDISRGETAESQLDAFIERREKERRKSEGERRTEELWAENERLYFERESRRLRWAWVHYFEAQAERAEANGLAIASANRERAQALLDELVAEERNGHHEKGGFGFDPPSRTDQS